MSLSVDSLPPNTLPTVLACETLADGVRLQLWLDPDLPWFTGHFPGAPLLPGVTQIHWVMHYAASLLKLAQPYQMQQLIAIVFARNREQDPSLRALAAEGRMYARSREQNATR